MWQVFTEIEWIKLEQLLHNTKLSTYEDVTKLLRYFTNLPENEDFKSLDALNEKLDVVNIFNLIKDHALKFPILFPSLSIQDFSNFEEDSQLICLSRSHVQCLLCHMSLCTLKKSIQHLYWITFEIWLVDGRCCTIAYLNTLLFYLWKSLSSSNTEQDEIIFKKVSTNQLPLEKLEMAKLCQVELELEGTIGELDTPEVSFANKNVGYGITATQEEMVFGSSPEICVSMLFCDTLKDNEVYIITGVYKVVEFNGYGLEISIIKDFPSTWRKREIIEMDALDFYDEPLKKQFEHSSLNRELLKAWLGYSSVSMSDSTISTGPWGCGAFGGNIKLKAIIQIISASLAGKNLIYYCFGNAQFKQDLSNFISFLRSRNISLRSLWNALENCSRIENGMDVFEYLQLQLS